MKEASNAVILIVDDKAANVLVLEHLLVARGRSFLRAATGEEALKIAINHPVDLILLDVQLPGMNGFEVAQVLKSNKKTKDIPIIFATAENKEQRFIRKGYDEGAVDYLFKPLDPEIVKAKVKVFLKLQMQKKELLAINASLQNSALLINNSADIIGIIDAATFRIDQVNQAFTEILGYGPEDMEEMPFSFFLSDEDREMANRLAAEDAEQHSFETRVYCKDRTIKWLQWKVVARYGKWFVNARDITGVKEGERIRNYLGTVVKQSNDAIYIHDSKGEIISWNQGAEKMYGFSEAQALSMKIWNIIPGYLQDEAEHTIEAVIGGKKISDRETQRITRHGKLLDVLFSASLIQESNQATATIVITEKDITRQKIAEDRLRENEQFLTSILNTMGDAVIVANAEGRPTLVNPAAEKLFGSRSADVEVAQWPETFGLFASDTQTLFPVNEIPLLQAICGRDCNQQEMFIRNERVPEGIYVITSSNPLRDKRGKLIGGVSVIHDISERKKAEEALKESEVRFRNLFEYAPYPMWVYDLNTLRFLEVNQPAIQHYGYSHEAFLSMDITDIRTEEEKEQLRSAIVQGRDVLNISTGWQHRLANGKTIDVEITSHLVDFRGHKAALVIAKDITEEKKVKEKIRQLNEELMLNIRQLESTNQELESFSYSVSHDLRSPLRGLNGYSQMLEEDYGHLLDEEGRRLLGRIQYNANRMGELIDDLLAFSRLGRKEVQKANMDMEKLVAEVLQELAATVSEQGRITVRHLPDAEGDVALIRQVWLNLIANAIKYSAKKEHPSIEIGAIEQGRETIYFVKDNGAGFDMKYADKLFGVFQRLHNRTDFEGTGIGLAIVQRIILKHEGRVWAEAVEQKGATFFFALPTKEKRPETHGNAS